MHPGDGIYQELVLSYGWVIFHGTYISPSVSPFPFSISPFSIHWWIFGLCSGLKNLWKLLRVAKDVIGLRIKRRALSWVMWMGPEGQLLCLHKGGAGGAFRVRPVEESNKREAATSQGTPEAGRWRILCQSLPRESRPACTLTLDFWPADLSC